MNETLSISVVVPFYNRSWLLQRLIDSVVSQSIPISVLYLIDNGSSDSEIKKCSEIVKENICKGTPIVWLSTIQKGNANIARNLGMDLSESKYVAFLDSDDWWAPLHLEESIQSLEKSNRSGSYSGAVIHHNNRIEKRESLDVNKFDDVFKFLFGKVNKIIAQTSSYIVKKEELSNVCWDEKLKRHQDTDFFIQFYYGTSGWLFVPHTNVFFDVASDGIKEIDYKSRIKFLEKWMAKIEFEELKNYLYNEIIVAIRRHSPEKYKKYYKKRYIYCSGNRSWARQFLCCIYYFEAREVAIKLVRGA